MKKNIYLTGFMGTGKSTVGKQLAKATGKKFIDTDREIEKKFSMSVNSIFDKKGESFFRQEEKKLVEELSKKSNMVISTGGGTIVDSENFEKLKSTGIMICLCTEKEELITRLKRTNKRPYLRGGNIEEKINKILAEREEVFNKIKIRVNTTNMTPREVVNKLLSLLKIKQDILFKSQYMEEEIYID